MEKEPSIKRWLAAILAADIAGYSRLMGQDEPATVRALKGHQAAILPLVARHGGRIVDTAGDGILAVFRRDSMRGGDPDRNGDTQQGSARGAPNGVSHWHQPWRRHPR